MTVEQLNIKITADASAFKKEIDDVNKQLDALKSNAAQSGIAVSAVFSELAVSGASGGAEGSPDGSAPAAAGVVRQGRPHEAVADISGRSSEVAGFAGSGWENGNAVMPGFAEYYAGKTGTAAVPRLERGDTVIGAVSGNDALNAQPVNITTTVQLDGDKVGESVERFYMRRNRMTNGAEE